MEYGMNNNDKTPTIKISWENFPSIVLWGLFLWFTFQIKRIKQNFLNEETFLSRLILYDTTTFNIATAFLMVDVP